MPRPAVFATERTRTLAVGLTLAWVSALGLLTAAAASAQLRVIVRAETRLELRASGTPEALAIGGALRDDLGAPLPERRLFLTLRSLPDNRAIEHFEVTTRADGTFAVTSSAPIGECVVIAQFAGESLYLGSEAEHRVDVRLAAVALALELPGGAELDLDRPAHELLIVATSAAGGEGLDIEVTTETGAPLGHATTDGSGRARLSLSTDALGGPSAGRLIASTSADAARAAARVELAIVRHRDTHTTLTAVLLDDDVVVGGTLSTSSGPRPLEAISIVAGEHLLETAMTDDTGAFSTHIPVSAFYGISDPVELRARFESDAPWFGSSESSPVELRLGSALPSLRSVALVSSLLLALALVVATLRRPRRPAELTPVRASVIPSARVGGTHVRLGVRLTDARTRAAIRDAEVRLVYADGTTAVISSDESGRAETVLSARASISVLAPGYEELRATVSVPHRGEWLDAELRLSSLRDAAIAPLGPIAERALGSTEAAVSATGREILTAAERRGRAPVLENLVERVERSAYGPDAPTRADVDEIRGEAAEALDELDRREPKAPRSG